MPPTQRAATADSSDDGSDYVAKEAIFIDGVRAYNAGDAVTASAVKNNDLRKQVEKPGTSSS